MTTTIYTLDGAEITTGLQSSRVCDEARQVARSIARQMRATVIVEDAPARQCYGVTRRGAVVAAPDFWAPAWVATR